MQPDQPNCAKCGKAPVDGCDGRGTVYDAERINAKDCPRMYLKHLAESMGPMAKVQHYKNSPLLMLGAPGEPPISDLTSMNVFIKECGGWAGFLPHLKWVLICKGMRFRYCVLDDRRLRDVYLGAEAYKSRPMSCRDDIETFNNVADLVGAEWHLVVIRLGRFGYKNKAAPGILKETLMVRAGLNRPIWLVDDGWSESRDADVEAYVNEHFRGIELSAMDPGIEIPKPFEDCQEDDPELLAEIEGPSECSEMTPDDSDLLGSLPGQGGRTRSKSRRRGRSNGRPV